ncbi:hypothetical protein BQ8482_500013 [Mesorhizobium delmotii]|uniref:Uncharacterized protein n=1 Tax=Mesorhizobium delmotii TaxID=1631247 RepID=A0A2P9AUG1_9HYPH|nr:hypothetical protein BQ8482_500013 [Mesorhizobium delmotii]
MHGFPIEDEQLNMRELVDQSGKPTVEARQRQNPRREGIRTSRTE